MKWNAKIGIGSVQFGLPYGISNTTGQTPPEEVSRILDFAFANGIRIIDTASGYGTSEAVIGLLHNNRFQLVSKFMPPQTGESISELLDKSLSLLKTDGLYGYLAHRPLDLLQDPKVWTDLQKIQLTGKIKKIGFSLNSPEEFLALQQAGLKPDLVQVPFNYFDTRFREILTALQSEGCEIHTRSTFLQGLFFTDTEKLSPFFGELKPKLQYLHKKYGEQLQGALLQYVLQQAFVDVVIMGIETVEQFEMNLNTIIDAPNLEPIDVSYSKELLMPMYWPKN